MTKHSMIYESRGGKRGKRKVVKSTKKSSAMSRHLRAAKRQVMNVLGGIGLITVIGALVYVIMGGGTIEKAVRIK